MVWSPQLGSIENLAQVQARQGYRKAKRGKTSMVLDLISAIIYTRIEYIINLYRISRNISKTFKINNIYNFNVISI